MLLFFTTRQKARDFSATIKAKGGTASVSEKTLSAVGSKYSVKIVKKTIAS